MKNWIKTSCILALSSLTYPAFAQSSVFAQEPTVMYAGPGYNYPSIDQVDEGQNLQLYGCLQDLSWCDVSNFDDRGWVPGDALGMQYGGRTVYLESSPTYFNAPILFFDIGAYWGLHYHNRPWYHDWRRYPPPPRPGPRPWSDHPYRPADGNWHDRDGDWRNRDNGHAGFQQNGATRDGGQYFRPHQSAPIQNRLPPARIETPRAQPMLQAPRINSPRQAEPARAQGQSHQSAPHSSKQQQGNHGRDDHHPNDHDH